MGVCGGGGNSHPPLFQTTCNYVLAVGLPTLIEVIPGRFFPLDAILEIPGGPVKISRIVFSQHLEISTDS